MRIRPFEERDLLAVSKIHETSFPRQCFSTDWIRSLSGGFPRTQIFVSDIDGKIVGFIVWTEKSGFRLESFFELEQITVDECFRRQGIGRTLIEQSLAMVKESLEKRGSCLKAILVSTRADNNAQRLYSKVLKAETVAVIPGLYSGDEVLMRGRY